MPEERDREWRDEFRKQLDRIYEGQEEMREKVELFQLEFRKGLTEVTSVAVKQEEMMEIRQRVRVLEDFRLRTFTVLVCAQGALAIVWAVLEKTVFK